MGRNKYQRCKISRPDPKFILLGVLMVCQMLGGQDVSDYQKQLDEISGQITQFKQMLNREGRKESTLLGQLDTIGLKKILARKEIERYDLQQQQVRRQQRITQQKIKDLQGKLSQSQDQIADILVNLYKFGRLHAYDLFLQVDDLAALISGHKNLITLVRTQEEILNDYLSTQKELKEAEAGLLTQNDKINEVLLGARKGRDLLADQERQNRRLIDQIKQDKKLHSRRITELEDRHQQLQNLIRDIIAQGSSLPFAPIPLPDMQGRLDWPITGRIISPFGTIRHPIYKTQTFNNGIEIAPRTDTIIKAVHPARVVYSDYFSPYGYLIILDHGYKYFTLYGRCDDKPWVKTGDVVMAGQALAKAGDIGSLEGKSLYFAIRAQDKFLDPLKWLKRR